VHCFKSDNCKDQEDYLLLLHHVLPGTSVDDKVLPVLHSHTGSPHCTVNAENWLTNFRWGTMIWYLSRVTGSPCPFTRVDIQLCQYGENGKVGVVAGAREKKREWDWQWKLEQCGQKRKRLLRGRKGSESKSPEEGDKPAKVNWLYSWDLVPSRGHHQRSCSPPDHESKELAWKIMPPIYTGQYQKQRSSNRG
jgi:hypothetical protein